MRLFLVARHGQSLFNVDSVVNGDPALDRGLSEQGLEEAERLAGQLGVGVRHVDRGPLVARVDDADAEPSAPVPDRLDVAALKASCTASRTAQSISCAVCSL